MRSTVPQFPEIRLPITDSKMQILRSFLNRFISIVNGYLFGNITAQDIITVNFAGVSRETSAIHNLGRTPKGFLVVHTSHTGAAMSITALTAKWTSTTITLVAYSTIDIPFTALIVVL